MSRLLFFRSQNTKEKFRTHKEKERERALCTFFSFFFFCTIDFSSQKISHTKNLFGSIFMITQWWNLWKLETVHLKKLKFFKSRNVMYTPNPGPYHSHNYEYLGQPLFRRTFLKKQTLCVNQEPWRKKIAVVWKISFIKNSQF